MFSLVKLALFTEVLFNQTIYHLHYRFCFITFANPKETITMFNCIIFDVDGTLIDTEFTVKKSLQKLLFEETLKEYSWDELDFILGIPGEVTLEKFGLKNVREASRRWNSYMIEFKNQVKVYDGIEHTLQKLKALAITTGIVTSKTNIEFRDDFIPFGLMPYFDFYVCASDTQRHKPFPDPLLKFLEISAMRAEQCIYIGDTAYDQQAANAARITFELALWGAKNSEEIDADVKIRKPQDILKKLNF